MAVFEYGYRMIYAILWKCWRVRKRHWIRTCAEILIPVLLVLLLVTVKAVMQPDDLPEETSKPTQFIAHDMKFLIRQLCQIGCDTGSFRPVLAYAPHCKKHHAFVIKLMHRVKRLLRNHSAAMDVKGFESEAEVEAFNGMLAVHDGMNPMSVLPVKTKLIGAVIFMNHPKKNSTQRGELVYKIRLQDKQFITGKSFADMEFPGPGKHFKVYENSGFLGLQLAIEQSYIELVYGGKHGLNIETQAFPYPPYTFLEKSHFTMILAMLLPAAIIMGFSYIVTNTITEIAKEKETGVTKFMNMLGLSRSGYWFSWMVNFCTPAVISVLLIVELLIMNVTGDGPVLIYSAPWAVRWFLLCYVFAAVWFCFFIATFFKTSGFANSLGVLAWLASFIIPALLISNKQRFLGSQLLASILPNMCLYWGFHTIANWESRVMGLRMSTLTAYPSTVESFNMLLIIVELIFDGFFYMILTLFMRRGHISKSKRLKNPVKLLYDGLYDDTKFPELVNLFRKCSTCCQKPVHYEDSTIGVDVSEYSEMGKLRTKVLSTPGVFGITLINGLRFDTEMFEPEMVNKNAGIKIRNVCKIFKGEPVIRSLSCDFYKNEVTVLLGPNGAGKTTLMNVLTGMIDMDEGTVWINRYDTRDYKLEARRSIGLCPQTDMLFEELTVMEHVVLFGWIRYGLWYEARNEAMKLVQQLNLKDVAKTRARDLSGGQKRKLCFAVSVVGNPKVILLDEATTGMDTESRKVVWSILQKIREDRTIVLTTHSMEEADILADRIAIMNGGTLRSFGTPQFLKKVHGSGYTMKFRVEEEKAEKLLRIISTVVPTAEVKSRDVCVGGEDLSFLVPGKYSPIFGEIFSQLYLRRNSLGLHAIDVHHTSMEEIFLGVKEYLEFEVAKREQKKGADQAAQKFKSPKKITGIFRLGKARLAVLMKKHAWLTAVNFVAFLCQYLLPLALVVSGIAGANRGIRNHDLEHYSEMKITVDDYDDPVILYNIPNRRLARSYDYVVGPGAKSTSLMDIDNVISEIGKANEHGYRNRYVIGASYEEKTITAYYNSIPYHSPPLAVNLVSNALLRYLLPMNRSHSITVENHPLQPASKESLESISDEGATAVVKAFCFYFAYSLAIVCAFVALRPLKEKACGSKHLQIMSGTSPFNFWLSYLLTDGAYILSLSGLALFLVWLTQESDLYTRDRGGLALFLILSIGGFACVNFTYFAIHVLRDPGASFGWFNMFHLCAAFASFLIYQTHPGLEDTISFIFYWVSVPFPVPFAVHALHTYAHTVIYNSKCGLVAENVLDNVCDKHGEYVYLPAYGCCPNCEPRHCFKPHSYFTTRLNDFDLSVLWDLFVMAVVGWTYFALIVLLDGGRFQGCDRCCLAAPAEAFEADDEARYAAEEQVNDDSAAAEAERVRRLVGLGENVPKKTGLLVDGICKNYGAVAAVSNVSFSTSSGECFGMLGINGAGKSTVFKILCGLESPVVGDVYLVPFSLLGDRSDFLSGLGYCPQQNSLMDDLTGRQLLWLYGSLRGVCPEFLHEECQFWLSALGLEHDSDRPCKDYSGGMQRRLCVATALIGDPRVVLLDEPTSSVDPAGKRHLWNTLQRLKKHGKIVILASHNVQECEILCDRIGLMVSGRMRHVETIENIKNMFLNGFSVCIRFAHRSNAELTGVDSGYFIVESRQEIETILGECILREAHQNMLRYLVPHRDQDWGELFKKLEVIRTTIEGVESYGITGSSLDEVFHAVAEMDAETSNVLSASQITCLQQILMGKCCSDEYA